MTYRSYMREDQIDPHIVTKVDTLLQLTIQLAKILANVVEAMSVGTPVMGVDSPWKDERVQMNEQLESAVYLGRSTMSTIVAKSHDLPEAWRLVVCTRCQRVWLGSDVASWRDLSTRADFVCKKSVSVCIGCNKEHFSHLEK